MYLQALVAVFRFLFGAMQGLWSGLAQAPTAEFYVWGRAVTAILGTATVWIVYRAAMRWGARTALLAAVMIAVMPLHVRESHYVLTDVPVTFFVMLTFLLSLRAHERSTAWSFALAGAAAGLAGATKYNGGARGPHADARLRDDAGGAAVAAGRACSGSSAACSARSSWPRPTPSSICRRFSISSRGCRRNTGRRRPRRSRSG